MIKKGSKKKVFFPQIFFFLDEKFKDFQEFAKVSSTWKLKIKKNLLKLTKEKKKLEIFIVESFVFEEKSKTTTATPVFKLRQHFL